MSQQHAYLFTADTTQQNFRLLLDTIDTVRAVRNWMRMLPGAAVLVSELDVDDLHTELKLALPEQRYLLVELERGNKNGWLPRKVWDFMNQPAPA